jgi:hypothetical protein
MIHDSIWESEGFATMTYRQRLLWIGLITTADDQGRGRAHPGLVRAAVFPFDVVSQEEIEEDLRAIADAEMALLYEVDGKAYYQVIHWWEYQSPSWASPSDYPPPEGWHDRLRYHEKGRHIVTQNWGDDATPYGGSPLPSPLPSQLPSDLPNTIEEGEGEGKGKGEEKNMSANADYQAIRKRWIELFPDKPDPRENNETLRGKVKTRMKRSDFAENWEQALERAAQSSFLHREGFFYLDWFLKNDDNWHKCLIGKYDDSPGRGWQPPAISEQDRKAGKETADSILEYHRRQVAKKQEARQ